MKRWTIDAPPPGSEVLWLTLDMASQSYRYDSAIVSKNDSSHFKYFDFTVTWRWAILPDQYVLLGAPPCLRDEATYKFYASQAPGARSVQARWFERSRSVTLLPTDKESDPNALALLLQTESSGRLQLMWAFQFDSDFIDAVGGSVDSEPRVDASFLRFSMGIATPKIVITASDVSRVRR